MNRRRSSVRLRSTPRHLGLPRAQLCKLMSPYTVLAESQLLHQGLAEHRASESVRAQRPVQAIFEAECYSNLLYY